MNRITPPQAYTREVLAKAYSWLKDQNDETKAKALTADALVSLYLQSLRHHREEKTAVFKAELHTMAQDLPRSEQLELSPVESAQKDMAQKFASATAQTTQPEALVAEPAPMITPDRSTSDQTITAYRKVDFPPVPKKFKASVEPEAQQQQTTPAKVDVATKSFTNLFPPGSFSKVFEEEAPQPTQSATEEPQDPEVFKLIEEVSQKLRIEDTKIVHKMLVSIGYEHLMSVFPKK